MFEFSPFLLLFWVFAGLFVPGVLFSLAILKKKELPLFDKAAIGLGAGLAIPSLFAFLLFLIGIPFGYEMAIGCIALFYIISTALFAKEKAWEGISLPKDYNKLAPSAALALIMLLAFWIRVGTYGPVFMELDPYFYIQHTALILQEGGAPLEDFSAWYPHPVSHRTMPEKAYLEAITYTLYNGGTDFDRYLLSSVAGMLPPIMAALAVFFLYLLVSSEYKRIFGIAAAGVAAFMPMFIMKLMAGESEVQPYAFFGIAFTLAMYALATKRKDLTFAFLGGIALMATFLGSASGVVVTTALLIFILLQALFLFYMKKDLEETVKVNGIIVGLGAVFPQLLQNLFHESFILEGIISGQVLLLLCAYALSLALFALQKNPPQLKNLKLDLKQAYVPAAIILGAVVLLVAFTPVGGVLFSIVKGVLGTAEFKVALERTIAEQGVAGAAFETELGFAAMDFNGLPTFEQLLGKFSSENVVLALFGLAVGLIQHIFAFFAGILTALSNLILSVMVSLLNAVFGTTLEYSDKNNSMLMVIIFAVFASLLYSAFGMFKKKEERLALLFAAFIFPVSIIGLMKTKYAIYLGFAIAAGLGVSLGELSGAVEKLIGGLKDEGKRKKYASYAMLGFTLISFLFVFFEWNNGLAGKLFQSSFSQRFGDDPIALQGKMENLCAVSGYAPACEAAEDPEAYASKGIAYQYDPILCAYSIYADPAAPTAEEQAAASLRCNTLTSYWIEFLEWEHDVSPENARFTSWWDYGHWTNYFGQRNTVLRNDHARHDMILEVAHGYIYGTPEELRDFMVAHDSEYAFFDREILINSDGSFGMKFSALNYLACSRNNETGVDHAPGTSECEREHTWERLAIPATTQACVLSPLTGEAGVLVYDAFTGTQKYCLGEETLLSGETIAALHKLDETYANGDLKLQKAFLKQIATLADGTRILDVYYTRDPLWLENGELKSGWEDRTTKFYDSVLYQAFVLEDVEGFTQVFKTGDGAVKAYKISE
jgi:asparagine N-glycosylation enzyme membrane subunit Stt3